MSTNQSSAPFVASGANLDKGHKFPIFRLNEFNEIVPDGMDDPKYVLDCMAYGFLSDTTGSWSKEAFPPPRDYFDCLRYLRWRQSGHHHIDGYPTNIRDIKLKEPHLVSQEEHNEALGMAYSIWSVNYLNRIGVPMELQQTKSLEELAGMGFDLSAVGIVPASQVQSMVRAKAYDKPSNESRSDFYIGMDNMIPGKIFHNGVPFSLLVGNSWRKQSAGESKHRQTVSSMTFGSTSQDSENFSSPSEIRVLPQRAAESYGGKSDSPRSLSSSTLSWRQRPTDALSLQESPTSSGRSVSDGSPIRSVSVNSSAGNWRYRSALALANKADATKRSISAINSRAARPQQDYQLPNTFEIVANPYKVFTILRVTDTPFNVTINEVLTHLRLGEREGIVNYGADNPAVHIIQDRSDSKTHGVFIEMLDFQSAQRVINDLPRRGLKIGSTGMSRKIKVDIVSRETMINAIFPRPCRVHPQIFRWIGDKPDLGSIAGIRDAFVGFISNEDLYNAAEWAEHPRKARHAEDSPQRVYDFMITTLLKLPRDRNAYVNLQGWSYAQFLDRLFNTVRIMIKTLNHYVDDPKFLERQLPPQHRHMLNFRLLKRLNQTAYDFPLFTSVQKRLLRTGQL